MIAKNVSCQLFAVTRRAGKAKSSGKDYDFIQATLLDERADKYVVGVADSIVDSLQQYVDDKNFEPVRVTVALEFYPKGYDFGARLTEIQF